MGFRVFYLKKNWNQAILCLGNHKCKFFNWPARTIPENLDLQFDINFVYNKAKPVSSIYIAT